MGCYDCNNEKVDEGCWVGYSSDSQGYCMDWLGKCHVMVEWNVMFDVTVHIQQGSMAQGEQDAS